MEENTRLSRAVYDGDCATVAQILDTNTSDSQLDPFSLRMCLSEAAEKGKMEIVELLISHMRNAGLPVQKAMEEAAEAGNVQMVRRLLQMGVRGDDGMALFHAAKSGDAKIVKILLECGANIEGEDTSGPLHVACSWGHKEVAQILLSNGADVNAIKIWGVTPLGMAAECLRPEMMQMLLDHGANIGLVSLARVLSEYREAVGMKLAGYYKHGARLLDTLGSIDASRSAAVEEYEAKFRVVLQRLIAAGADVSVRGEIGESPLHGAALLLHPDVATSLIAAGADVNALDSSSATPLDWALSTQVESVVSTIVEHGGVAGSGYAPPMDGGCRGCPHQWGSR